MIILSRSRTETSFETELAETIAERFQEHVLSVPFLYDLRSFGSTLNRLRTLNEPSVFLAAFPRRASESLLQFLGVGKVVAVMDISNSETKQIFKFLEKNRAAFSSASVSSTPSAAQVEHLDEPTVKRWYPVIDKTECIGCLECVNFCLFGVYVIGKEDKPLVDQPDACRNGCPACARVCPGAAIMFPMHDEPDISGRSEAEFVRQKFDPAQAEKERSQHRPAKQYDELDVLVEQIDLLQL